MNNPKIAQNFFFFLSFLLGIYAQAQQNKLNLIHLVYFFLQVGDPGIDHGQWESGSNVKGRRPAYKLTKNDPGSDLAGETAAALAAASILFVAVGKL